MHAGSPWQPWLRTAVIVVAIWALTALSSGGLTYFWPIWVIGPWGAILLAQTLTGGRDSDRERPRQHR